MVFTKPKARVAKAQANKVYVFVRANTRRGAKWRGRIEASNIISIRHQNNITVGKAEIIGRRGNDFRMVAEGGIDFTASSTGIRTVYQGKLPRSGDRNIRTSGPVGYYVVVVE